jgi:hypothetical protein
MGQVADMFRVAVVNGVMPHDYYFGGLARHAGSDEIFRYVPPRLFGGVTINLTRKNDPRFVELAQNKLLFERQCRADGIPVVETIAFADAIGVRNADGRTDSVELPPVDLIIKPAREWRGVGVERWRSVGNAYVGSSPGHRLSASDLRSRAAALARSRRSTILIQRCLTNACELEPFAGSALATTRFVTIVNEKGEPEVVDAFYRTSIEPDAAVDNFHAGGVLFPLDLKSGQYRPGFTFTPWPLAKITHHPSTGTAMLGIVHPGWEEMRALALRLHGLFLGVVVVGSDIAFTPRGPVVVEAHSCPEASINRQCSFDGLVGTRWFNLLAFHASQWLAKTEPPHSRWRYSGGSPPATPQVVGRFD